MALRDKLGELEVTDTGTFQDLFECPALKEATVKITVVNNTAGTPAISVAHCTDAGAPQNKNLMEEGTVLEAKTAGSLTFAWTATMKPGQRIAVKTDTSGVIFAAEGILHNSPLTTTSTTTTSTTTTTTTSTTTDTTTTS
jgi:hypothetical protein